MKGTVIPAKAGIQALHPARFLDPRLPFGMLSAIRGGDDKSGVIPAKAEGSRPWRSAETEAKRSGAGNQESMFCRTSVRAWQRATASFVHGQPALQNRRNSYAVR